MSDFERTYQVAANVPTTGDASAEKTTQGGNPMTEAFRSAQPSADALERGAQFAKNLSQGTLSQTTGNPTTGGVTGGAQGSFGSAGSSGNVEQGPTTSEFTGGRQFSSGGLGDSESGGNAGEGQGGAPTGGTGWQTEQNPANRAGLRLGKGLDIGTVNLAAAVQNEKGGITIKLERNAFIDINSDVYSKRMLTKLKVPYVIHNGKMIVLGDAAFELSNIFGRETRRPMKDGLISPNETDALPMVKLIIEKVLGPIQAPGEPCFFSVPAPSIDKDNNIIYHQGLFEGILRKLGYTPKAMNEGHAVVFAELAEQNFTGIGISCGGGMFNICVSYKTIPALSFSISRGGDWIDSNVATVLGITAARATYLKERGVDITNPTCREDEAIVIYYRNLINYTLQNIKAKFEVASDMPEFREPVDIVCSGGTSMIKGFEKVFWQELQNIKFPIKVAKVRRAAEPLTSVAKGCLIAAAISEQN
ncbi:MAG: hypothetical protein HYR85_12600 [Planctomycetes bacterium]|nr:hypothetical protein [Planctomycetota bacterium]MBI3844300.1 hypothetical protein [Planctomycetota bacterium]